MKIRAYSVNPSLPKRLNSLLAISRNIYWTWSHNAVQLFQRMDMDKWESAYHNPIRMLGELSQERLNELLNDESFLNHMDDVALELEDYLHTTTWYGKHGPKDEPLRVAYFSMEYGLHESVPIYSGGLGLLSGDHLKSASDLGIPLVALGLLYRQGYFRQYLNPEGWQQETYPENDFAALPIEPVKDADGRPVIVHVDLPGRQVAIQTWKLAVGRVTLLMLDANLPANSAEDREITGQLYGGDLEMRIKQEIVLGIGGMRLLRLLDTKPTVCHMNEGHSAFLAVERTRHFMETYGLNFSEASEIVRASNVFTTHTPVPAGNDIFPPDLVDRYFHDYYTKLGLNREQFLGLGRQNPFDRNEPFCMTVLAIRLAAHRNGVSRLHGQVSRAMWKNIWPGLSADELPIDHITNGVHAAGWVSTDMAQLYGRYLGPRWRMNPEDGRTWEGIGRVPDAELWRTHERRRERLVAFARKKLSEQLTNRGALRSDLAWASEVLDPEALTLGFARRFATYKRGALILSDPERLARILNNRERPMQIIFAGKAHPQDNAGKEVIKRIAQLARDPRFRSRIVFIENYDINVARYLVQGVDVWVNNPRRPLEASGTSGMKVSMNGGINLSVLDGWWDEAYRGDNGWAIGRGEEYKDTQYQDEIESRALFDLLEDEIVPLFYTRASDGVPRGWTALMKHSIQSICPVFNTSRMVIEYLTKFYLPGSRLRAALRDKDFAAAKELAAWMDSIRRRWMHIEILDIQAETDEALRVGATLPVRIKIRLPGISPREVRIEAFHGLLDSKGEVKEGRAFPLSPAGEAPHGDVHVFEGALPLAQAGRCGFGVRVVPNHPLMIQRFEPGLILWA
ncbi:MAG: glycosyltransferase family 1 protein [Myxococcales bacterium]|nr:MAG: glycosyltransferase family 1 protein [Myxococcales bacterium]